MSSEEPPFNPLLLWAAAARVGAEHQRTMDQVKATMNAGEKLREVIDGLCGSTDWKVYDTHGYCLTHAVVIPSGQPCPVTLAAFKKAANPRSWRSEYNHWRAVGERRGIRLGEIGDLAVEWEQAKDATCCDSCQQAVVARRACGEELRALVTKKAP